MAVIAELNSSGVFLANDLNPDSSIVLSRILTIVTKEKSALRGALVIEVTVDYASSSA